jgi:tRNA dimethylallyltransferase
MKKVIVLLGPTGVGKTGAAILLARALNTEIISSDSMQIYRGMDIGTAKPTKMELAEVKHHLIDIIEPTESYSAGRYVEEVTRIIECLHKKKTDTSRRRWHRSLYKSNDKGPLWRTSS